MKRRGRNTRGLTSRVAMVMAKLEKWLQAQMELQLFPPVRRQPSGVHCPLESSGFQDTQTASLPSCSDCGARPPSRFQPPVGSVSPLPTFGCQRGQGRAKPRLGEAPTLNFC